MSDSQSQSGEQLITMSVTELDQFVQRRIEAALTRAFRNLEFYEPRLYDEKYTTYVLCYRDKEGERIESSASFNV